MDPRFWHENCGVDGLASVWEGRGRGAEQDAELAARRTRAPNERAPKMSIRALVEYNARRCENAVGSVCRCQCGGALHGKKHGKEWIEKATDDVLRARAYAKLQADWLAMGCDDDGATARSLRDGEPGG